MAGGVDDKKAGLNVRKVVVGKTFAASPVAGNIVTIGAEDVKTEADGEQETPIQEKSAYSPSVPDSAVVIADQSEEVTATTSDQAVVDENYWTPERIEEYHRQQAEYEAATAAYNAAVAEAEAAASTTNPNIEETRKKSKKSKKKQEDEEEDDEDDDELEA